MLASLVWYYLRKARYYYYYYYTCMQLTVSERLGDLTRTHAICAAASGR